jgi:hypothetical protein
MKGLKSAAELSANKPHGTRLKYVGGCKCMLCRAANSRYETERVIARKAGDWNGLVRAAAARKHLLYLSSVGVGRRAVAAATDIADSILFDVRSGKKTQIRKRTETKILGVTKDAVSDHALIDADPTWRQINKLLSEGFSKAELSRRLDYKNGSIQFDRFEVTAVNAARVDRFYRLIMAEAEEAA